MDDVGEVVRCQAGGRLRQAGAGRGGCAGHEDVDPVAEHLAGVLGGGDDDAQAAVLRHVPQPGRGVGGVQRDVGGVREPGGQYGDDHVHRARQVDADEGPAGDAPFAQALAEGAGPQQCLAVGELLLVVGQGHGVGGPAGLREDAVQGAVLVAAGGPGAAGPLLEPGAFLLAEQLEPADRPGGVGDQVGEQGAEVLRHAACGVRVEHVGLVLQYAPQAGSVGCEGQSEFGLGDAARGAGDARVVRRHPGLLAVAEGGKGRGPVVEQCAEERVLVAGAGAAGRAHDLGERYVLVRGQPLDPRAEGGQKVGEGRVAGQVAAQRQGVHQKADQVLGAGQLAVGPDGAQAEVVAVGAAGQQQCEGGGVDGVRGHRVVCREVLDRPAQFLGQGEVDRAAAAVAAGVVVAAVAGGVLLRQVETAHAVEFVREVAQSGGEAVLPQGALLPGRVVAEVVGDGCVGGFGAVRQFPVQRMELVEHQRQRPAVADDVVRRQAQHLFAAGDVEQEQTQQGRAGQVEGGAFLGADPFAHRGSRGVARGEVLVGEGGGEVLVHDLDQFAVAHLQARPQRLVPPYEAGQGVAEQAGVEGPGDAQGHGGVVLGAAGLHLLQEPQAALPVRGRVDAALLGAFQRRPVVSRGEVAADEAEHMGRQLVRCGVDEGGVRGEGDAGEPAEPVAQLQAHDGVQPELLQTAVGGDGSGDAEQCGGLPAHEVGEFFQCLRGGQCGQPRVQAGGFVRRGVLCRGGVVCGRAVQRGPAGGVEPEAAPLEGVGGQLRQTASLAGSQDVLPRHLVPLGVEGPQ